MKNYDIVSTINKDGITEEWIYLVGTLLSEKEIETVCDYKIVKYNLSYKYPHKEYLYETFGYNVLVIGKLYSENEIIVHLIFDSPDITGKGIVCLTKYINNEYIPRPFIYLPMREKDKQISKHLCHLKSPFFTLQKDIDMDFIFIDEMGNHLSKDDFKEIDIILLEAGGYDIGSPAFYLGLDKDAVTLKKEKIKKNSDIYENVLVFKGKQVCKRKFSY